MRMHDIAANCHKTCTNSLKSLGFFDSTALAVSKGMRFTAREILSLSKEATPDEICRAYRLLAKRTHPDAGGNAFEFMAVERAFRILSNPELNASMGDLEIFDCVPEAIKNNLESETAKWIRHAPQAAKLRIRYNRQGLLSASGR